MVYLSIVPNIITAEALACGDGADLGCDLNLLKVIMETLAYVD